MPPVADVFGNRSGMVSAADVHGASTMPGQQPKPEPIVAQPPRPAGQMANVRLEVTITEQRDTTTIPTRTITLVLADREHGYLRTTDPGVVLNVDARAEIVREGRIRVSFGLEYKGQAVEGDPNAPPLVNQNVTTILEEGKPTVVSQSADARSPRSSVRVELKATILK